ncbi:MAG TPA: RnfABCDGE type electron transport complex subunit D [bacterium]|nr:RnfABCDGE type electron transport complex subunit D [bacterium]
MTTRKAMLAVLLALLPAIVASGIVFGYRALALIVVCGAVCVITEAAFQYFTGRKVCIQDGSALLSGVLLALILPANLPFYQAVVGSAFAMLFGKHLFGGLGRNIWNPALLGRAFLMAAYPVSMTNYPRLPDAVTQATPLAAMKFNQEPTSLLSLFFGNVSGSLGETSAVALIIGGVLLIWLRYADWRIPTGMLGAVIAITGANWVIRQGQVASPLFHLLSGGLLIGAFFMATDPVTTPVTKLGRWIFGLGVGFLVALIRLKGGYPEGVMFAILLMNSVRPLLDRLTVPKTFGQKRVAK